VVSEYEDEDDASEQQQEPGVLEGAPDTEASGASAAAAEGAAEGAAEAEAEAPAAAGEGSAAEGGAGEDEDDDGFVKVGHSCAAQLCGRATGLTSTVT
jgi:hypothetical protein